MQTIHSDQHRQESRWPVTGSVIVAVPAERVWEVISAPGNLLACHPFCKDNPVKTWPGAGSQDEVHYLSGWLYERHVHSWLEGEGYDLAVGRPGGSKSDVSWRISELGQDHSKLTITVYPSFLEGRPVLLRWLAYRLKIRPLLSSYLDSVVRGFEWYLTHGEPVPRNEFGTHPWFS